MGGISKETWNFLTNNNEEEWLLVTGWQSYAYYSRGFTDQNAQNGRVTDKNEEDFGVHPRKWAINEVIQVDMKYPQLSMGCAWVPNHLRTGTHIQECGRHQCDAEEIVKSPFCSRSISFLRLKYTSQSSHCNSGYIENMFYGLPNEFALRSRPKVGLPKKKAQNPVVENNVFPH